MARIIVTTERSERPEGPVLFDELVCPAHLSDDHSAAQLIERLGWAVTDAEAAEQRLAVTRRVSEPSPTAHRQPARSSAEPARKVPLIRSVGS